MIHCFSGPPDFDEILANCTAELGQTVKLACKATGVPKPTVTWYKGTSSATCLFQLFALLDNRLMGSNGTMPQTNICIRTAAETKCVALFYLLDVDGRAVEADPHHIIIEDPDGSCTLILDNMTADDSGQYMCFATSSAGNASTLGKITVQGKCHTV